MLRSLKKLLSKRDAAPAFIAPIEIGRPTYAIGDIHGRADLLERLMRMIEEDVREEGLTNVRLVFLGDYVDRGEQSREVLKTLSGLKAQSGDDIVFLKGNHEEMLLEFLNSPEEEGPRWLRNGGLQTLMSFGVRGVSGSTRGEEALDARDRFLEALGDSIEFLNALKYSFCDGAIAFTHAGADPALPMNMQGKATLIWGARDFLSTLRTDGLWVVHGHYVEDEPFARNGRIAVDTGACFTGRLTAARIHDGQVAFMTT